MPLSTVSCPGYLNSQHLFSKARRSLGRNEALPSRGVIPLDEWTAKEVNDDRRGAV
jgi:hypothetical protein